MAEIAKINMPLPAPYPIVSRELPTVDRPGWVEIDGIRLRKDRDICPQLGFQEAIQTCPADIIFSGGSASAGKGMIISELVVTPFGFRKAGDLKVGSIVSGVDGGIQRVIGVYPQGIKDIYEFEFIDGATCQVTEEHLWNIRVMRKQSKKAKLRGLKIDEDYRVWTTPQIIEHLNKKPYTHISVPLSSPIQFTVGGSVKKDIPPYILGCLLGDGCITGSAGISFCNPDKEVIEKFKSFGYDLLLRNDGRGINYTVKHPTLVGNLKKLKLYGCHSDTKFIPKIYKLGTIDERMELIRGLMDTDGYNDNDRTSIGYSSASLRLSKDIQEIIWSLGGHCSLNTRHAGYKDKNGRYVECFDRNVLYIQTQNNKDLFSLSRKQDKATERRYTKTRRIVSVRKVDRADSVCIAVSNPDSLFMVGKGCIVTHNTFAILLEAMRGLGRQNYSGLIVKKELVEVGTAGGILSDARRIYKPMSGCEYSASDLSFKWDEWNSSIMLTHLNLQGKEQEKEAQEKMKNKQASYLAVDELTNFTFPVWKYWLSRNRDDSGITPKMICTLNAQNWHWSSKMLTLGGYIGDDRYVRPEMVGKIRYILIQGETESDIIWADSPEEMLQKAPSLEKMVTPEMKEAGITWRNLIKSFTFIPGNISDNRILTFSTKGGNITNLFNVGEAERMKLLYGYWGELNEGDALVNQSQIESLFNGDNPIDDSNERYITGDLSDGGINSDAIKLYVWQGLRVVHIETIYGVQADKLPDTVRLIANEWDVPIEHIAVDATGGGQYFDKYMRGVVGVVFNKVPIKEYDEAGNQILLVPYSKLRDQLYGKLSAYINTGRIRIEVNPDRKFPYGRKQETMALRDILKIQMLECLVSSKNEHGKIAFRSKIAFKHAHNYSPDDLDAMAMRMIFELDAQLKKPAEETYTIGDMMAAFNNW